MGGTSERGHGGTGSAAGPSVLTYRVEGGAGVYLLVDLETRDIRGTLVDLGGGWWRCRTSRGDKREVFVPADVEEPWRDAAERVSG